VRRSLRRCFACGDSIQQAKDGLRHPAGEHAISLEVWMRGRCDAYHRKEDLKWLFPLWDSVSFVAANVLKS
jgi:hypothetical protein